MIRLQDITVEIDGNTVDLPTVGMSLEEIQSDLPELLQVEDGCKAVFGDTFIQRRDYRWFIVKSEIKFSVRLIN